MSDEKEQQNRELIEQPNQALERPAVTPQQLVESIKAMPSLQRALTTKGEGRSARAIRESRQQQITDLAAIATGYQQNTLLPPTAEEFIEAQNETHAQPKRRTTEVTSEKIATPIEGVAQRGVQAIIASQLADGRIPESSTKVAQNVGVKLTSLLQHLGDNPAENKEIFLNAVSQLPEVQQMILWHMMGTQRKKTEFGYPDIAYCAEKEVAEYLAIIAWQEHGTENSNKIKITPTEAQRREMDDMCEALINRIEDQGYNGSAEISLEAAMDALLQDETGEGSSPNLTYKQKATLSNLLQIAQGNEPTLATLLELFASHPKTKYIAINAENLGSFDSVEALVDPTFALRRRHDSYGEEDEA